MPKGVAITLTVVTTGVILAAAVLWTQVMLRSRRITVPMTGPVRSIGDLDRGLAAYREQWDPRAQLAEIVLNVDTRGPNFLVRDGLISLASGRDRAVHLVQLAHGKLEVKAITELDQQTRERCFAVATVQVDLPAAMSRLLAGRAQPPAEASWELRLVDAGEGLQWFARQTRPVPRDIVIIDAAGQVPIESLEEPQPPVTVPEVP